jgi:hypothetical protein
VNCLMEIEECGRLTDRTIVPELWNFKENRKATCSECVEYIFSQVKRLNGSKGRTTRRFDHSFLNILLSKFCLSFMTRNVSLVTDNRNTGTDLSSIIVPNILSF